MTREWIRIFLPPLLFLAGLILFLQAVVDAGLVPSFILPSPLQVAEALEQDQEVLLQGSFETLMASFSGLLLALVFGVSLAFLFSLNRWIKNALYPYTVFFQTVPVVAIAPLLVIWFGFGLRTVQAAAAIVSLFPVLANTMTGLSMVSRENHELFQALGATPSQTLYKLAIPSALPSFFAGLRVAAGLSVVGAIVGEFIAGGGLGSVIDAARTQQRVDLVFAAILLSAAIGFLLVTLVDAVRFVLLRLRPFFD